MAEKIPSINQLLERARVLFQENFTVTPEIAVCAPGRVNLIGEHTDYNDGFVLPMALPLVTVVLGAKRPGNTAEIAIEMTSKVDEPHKVSFDVEQFRRKSHSKHESKPKWANYVKGVVANFREDVSIPGFRAVIVSSVPIGGGVSSSAALEVATYTFLEVLTGKSSNAKDKALACQKAEHDYAGMPCGIMDQFISVLGEEGNALLIDCRSMESELVPVDDPEIAFLVINSNIKHELTGSEYPTRKKQCMQAASLLNKKSLRDASMQDVDCLKKMGADESVMKRARHVVGEIWRTRAAARALKEKSYTQFGQFMIESHRSLKDDFEVSCPEIDQLVEIALQVDGVLGSRMTGGGFGGCTVTMMYESAVNDVIEKVKNNYNGNATFYKVKPSGGPKILQVATE